METILIKLSGTLFNLHANAAISVEPIIAQLAELSQRFRLGLVIGGGNIFRGSQQGKFLPIQRTTADTIGMLATMMNGLILRDLLQAHKVPVALLSAFDAPAVAQPITNETIRSAQEQERCIIFCGGTGLPYFSTDTNAVIRALQIGATTVWKATNVDYLYSADPARNPQATPIKMITYDEVIARRLSVMDATAIQLASQQRVTIRVFNLFSPLALLMAADQKDFGSTIAHNKR